MKQRRSRGLETALVAAVVATALSPTRNDVCRRDATSEFCRFVTSATGCAVTRGATIPSRAGTLHRPSRQSLLRQDCAPVRTPDTRVAPGALTAVSGRRSVAQSELARCASRTSGAVSGCTSTNVSNTTFFCGCILATRRLRRIPAPLRATRESS